MAADTITQADELEQYTELDALGVFLSSLVCEVNDAAHGVASFNVSWDGLDVVDPRNGKSGSDLYAALFPSDGADETAEWRFAAARSDTLVARLYGWLASAEGRAFCERQALYFMGLARRDTAIAQRLTIGGGDVSEPVDRIGVKDSV
ncbi:MAG TPA: hypothetical protein VFA30_10285 [Gaiellaceae bacterium]|nr:hypothetical protein [Gaiellaceae bacterium]